VSLVATAKHVASAALHGVGLLHALAWYRRRVKRERLLILTFHSVSPPGDPYFRPSMDIAAGDFRALLAGLGRHYPFLPLEEAVASDAPCCAVTFDDGYRNVHDVAFPILRELGVPATVFLPTAFIGTGRRLWWDEVRARLGDGADAAVSRLKYLPEAERDAEIGRLPAAAPAEGDARVQMDWDEVRAMAEAGVGFGNHTVNHVYLDALPPEDAREEMVRAHEEIERQVGRAPTAIAYPDGRFDDGVLAETRRLGYGCGVTTITGTNGPRDDRLALKRHDGSQSFSAGGRFRFPLARAELLGFWDTVLLRRLRAPERYSTYRPSYGPASPPADR